MGEPTVKCRSCQRVTPTGLLECEDCWEVERRLRDYLQYGGEHARSFVIRELERATPAVRK